MNDQLARLVDNVSERLNLNEHQVDDDGAYRLEFDKQVLVVIRELDRMNCVIETDLGPVPQSLSMASPLLQKALTLAQLHYKDTKDVICVTPGTSRFRLFRQLPLLELTPSGLYDNLEQFVNVAAAWRQRLATTDSPSTPLPSRVILP
ncbi:CesT family type III secretion system chaperone [Bremerella sp. JC770]|uniref:CesT family type III secretion system chaperone n=1 Tax=Bremerella sp. JC770 TaxID=3232137 RepID=UPI00345880EE